MKFSAAIGTYMYIYFLVCLFVFFFISSFVTLVKASNTLDFLFKVIFTLLCRKGNHSSLLSGHCNLVPLVSCLGRVLVEGLDFSCFL